MPTFGRGVPTASRRGTSSKVAENRANWLHHPSRVGGAQRFKAGQKIRIGPKVGYWLRHPCRMGGASPTHGTDASARGNRTCLILVLFGGWSAQAVTHVPYLSLSADGVHGRLHISPTCPFRRMVCSAHLLVLFRGWSAQAITHVPYLSFSADGLHRRLHISPTCPFRRIVCPALLLVLFGGWCAQAITHVSYLSFSEDDLHRCLHMSPDCPFFGGWSA